MAKGLNNWVYKDVRQFLKEYGFDFNVHGTKSFPIMTLETMIRQSKIDKKVWKEWTTR
jgi:Asp-tRNA(Asn)/Glu-tRNA(Gln) amidotransferase B subunit